VKIAVDGSLLSGVRSGVEHAILGLVTGLSRVRTTDTVLLYVGKKFRVDGLPGGCVKLRRSWGAGRRRLPRIIWQQTLLPAYARAERVDVFHGPGYVLPALGSIPAVVTVYDIIALTRPELCRRSNVAHYRRVLPRSVRRARRIIVPTQAVARQVVDVLGASEERIRVIPCGVDARFRPAPDAEQKALRLALGLPGRFVLFVGNLEPKKNLVMLVRAFFAAKANRRLPHKLVLAGRYAWKYRPILDEIESLGIEDDVVLPGYVPREALPALYSAAEMFVFPSLVEGFGLPPLEAMACGTPAIVSKDPALRESTGGAALEVDADDLPGLRDAIEALAGKPELRAELARKGTDRAAQFTWSKAAQATFAVYREAAESARTEVRPEDLLK